MRITKKINSYFALLLASAITISALAGCSSKDTVSENNTVDTQETLTTNESLRFKPSDTGIARQEKYEYPYIGLTASLTPNLLDMIDSKDVFMTSAEDYDDNGALSSAFLSWYALTEEQKSEEVTAFDPDQWTSTLAMIGSLGVCRTDQVSDLDNLTNCTTHKELGKSTDGEYTYYMSLNEQAPENLKEELEQTTVTISEMLKIDLNSGLGAFSEARVDTSNIGNFQTTDINGTKYTSDIFKDYDLTLVNIFATWCSPCLQELPEFEELKEEMASKGVNVIAIAHDTIAPTGKTDAGAIEKATYIQQKLKLTFPILIPDETDMNGRLKGIQSFPESFFVDRDGNIVSDPYVGARSFDAWKTITEQELAKLKGVN